MANIHVTSTANSILVDFKDLSSSTPANIEKGTWSASHVFFGKYANYIEVVVDGMSAWAVSFDGYAGTFQIDLINGAAPTSNDDLYTKLSACKG